MVSVFLMIQSAQANQNIDKSQDSQGGYRRQQLYLSFLFLSSTVSSFQTR